MVNFGVSSFVNFVRSRKGLMRPDFFSLESTLLKIVTSFLTNPWLFDLLLCRKVYQTMVLAIGSILFKSPVEFMEKINHQVTAIHLLLVVQQNIVSPCPEVSLYKISEVHEGSPQHIYHALTCQDVRKSFMIFAQTGILNSHHEAAHWSCDSNTDTHVQAHFNPGRITLDGQVDDWKDIDGSAFSVLPALDPDADEAYNGGKMTVKASHDGKDVFFMLQVDGDYTYSEGYSNKTASVAFMFQIGENASYHRMGGCEEEPDTCTSKSCKGHEVDLMHFSIGTAIPGRLYGGNLLDNSEGNGGDRFGHLVDLYCWNPHCRYLDGYGPSVNDTTAQNDWKGTWWHSSLTHSGFIKDDSPYSSSNQSGAYYFEFSRPLRTMDRLQQDAQFTIGKTSKMSVAFWYPMDGKPWHGSGHFSINCDWILLDILPDSSELTKVPQRSSWDAATAFSLLFSVVAFCISIFVGHRVSRTKNIPFTPMSNL